METWLHGPLPVCHPRRCQEKSPHLGLEMSTEGGELLMMNLKHGRFRAVYPTVVNQEYLVAVDRQASEGRSTATCRGQ